MKTIKLKCVGCENEIYKAFNEYNRQLKKGNNNFYCSLSCCAKYTSKKRIKHKEIERECLYCKSKFISTTHKRHKKCCNIDCAVKYSQTFVNVNEISKSLKKYFKENPKIKKILNCKICNKSFLKGKNNKKTCSDECYKKLVSTNSIQNPNCGGETNYKKFQYKGIWMDSSWEINIAKWLDENKIKWIRDRKINFLWTDLSGKKRRYYPDFLLPELNVYLDPKNKYKLEKDKYKLNQVIKENKINLIFGLENDILNKLKEMI